MTPAILCRGVAKRFGGVAALGGLDFEVAPGEIVGLLGPDGAGKTTLLRLLAGLYRPDAGSIGVLGFDSVREAQSIQNAIGYMPQKFGLYEDLTVWENLKLYADLRAVPPEEQRRQFDRLLGLTDLARFADRFAGRLSGGMKQKLSLACTLISTPKVLLLDEPTVGVDVLARRELWGILTQLAVETNLTVLVSTAYLDEADYCGRALILYEGCKLAEGTPAELAGLARGKVVEITVPPGIKPRQVQKYLSAMPETVNAAINGRRVRWTTPDGRTLPAWGGAPGEPRFEDGFMTAIFNHLAARGETLGFGEAAPQLPTPHPDAVPGPVVVRVGNLVKKFGSFTAVNRVSFEVRKGEIFGLLGANGAGKSTTFRMLCGLTGADGGELEVAGVNLRRAAVAARRKLGFVAQKFSLYGDLTVRQNLDFFGGAYGLAGKRRIVRIDWALDKFHLSGRAETPAGKLPGGYKQRLSMACALLHEPEIIFLDEPTSGADPRTRREFWLRINELADSGVTVIITTHFLDEAEYCDRMVIMQDGVVPAAGTPEEIRRYAETPANPNPELGEAFVEIIRAYRREHGEA